MAQQKLTQHLYDKSAIIGVNLELRLQCVDGS